MFVKYGCSIYVLLNSAILICRGTDISKYFRKPLGIRDNESRLYMQSVVWHVHYTLSFIQIDIFINCSFESGNSISYNIAYVLSRDSDQPVHPHCLISLHGVLCL